MLKKLMTDRSSDWDRYLPAVLFAYRENPQESTGFAPFELLCGRTIKGPSQILPDVRTGKADSVEVRTTYQYVSDLKETLSDMVKRLRQQFRVQQNDTSSIIIESQR